MTLITTGLVEIVQVAVHRGIGVNLVMAWQSVLCHAVTSAGDGVVFILLPVRWFGRLVYIDTSLITFEDHFFLKLLYL